jgi:hypothetical protein
MLEELAQDSAPRQYGTARLARDATERRNMSL